jgi:putative intracellular protease/amidase
MARRVLIPLPDRDFDVTEVAVPWRLLTNAGHHVTFATENGATPACDPLLLTGVLFGKLGAAEEPKAYYAELEKAPKFLSPTPWAALDLAKFDALVLPGGHAPGMKQYLGSTLLQDKVRAFAKLDRPIAAICHGVLVLARARHPKTGLSPIHKRKTTCLPKYMERSAYLLTFWKLGRYYRTYPEYVEDEVKAALADPAQFIRGPKVRTQRGTATDDTAAFVVSDGQYLSARWPGDAYLFSKKLLDLL